MTLQFATITGFFGQLKDRFKFYHETKILEEKLSLISQVEGNQGVELIILMILKINIRLKLSLKID